MWHCVDDSLPGKPGTYSIKLFSDAERKAYWTGKVWVDVKRNKRINSLRFRGDFHFLRFWNDGHSGIK